MPNLAYQRCFNHALREAVARCPECKNYFCRECVTEHEDRVLCAARLKKIVKPASSKRAAFAGLMRIAECAVGILLAWFFFFVIGEILVQLPDSFHEGALWQVPWIEQ